MEIKKAIIPVAGLGTRFLPLSKAIPKELWPLADKPLIHYIISEAKGSGIEEIIFVLSPENKKILDYLKPSPTVEKLLKERKKEEILNELKSFEELLSGISFNYVIQKKPLGDGHAILQAEKLVKDEPVVCLFSDDIVESSKPAPLQLIDVFKTCQKPVLSLYSLSEEKLSAYGIVGVEKIANRLFKIRKITEKPKPGEAPSNLCIVGKYVLTPDVFSYLKKAKPSAKGEIILAEVLGKMLEDGKTIYGYEFEGRWFECGSKSAWLKSNLYFSLNHPKFGPELRKFLRENKI